MIKTITIAASAATLSAILMTPATAAPKQPTDETAVQYAPGRGPDVVERRGHHHGRHHGFYSYGRSYSPCYWGWRYGKKVWFCY